MYDLLTHVFNHLLSLNGGQLNGAFFQNGGCDDDDVLRAEDVLNRLGGGPLTSPRIVEHLVHGEKFIDVHVVWGFLERLNENGINEDLVALAAFFQACQDGVIKTDHIITCSRQR